MTVPASNDSEDISELLRQALNESPVNYGRVLELSSKLANSDPNVVRFSVDAGHISRLGRELVAKQDTAVAELVKNAYDADATNVALTFDNADRAGGMLEVVDDGNGMSRDDLIQGFMRLSSTLKVHAPKSPLFQRQRAGRKGIGRFAAQRLGRRLIITTQTSEAETAIQVGIDWDAFAGDRELSSIGSTISDVPKQRSQGTTLRIEGLREHWSDAAIKNASKHVLDLIQPFPLSQQATQASPTKDPGFKAIFKRRVGASEYVVADEQQLLLNHALAIIDGSVDSNGNASWSVVSRRLRVDDRDVPIGPGREVSGPYSALRNVKFRVYYFIAESSYVPKTMVRPIQSALRSRGGIRLYRNGFRVVPYGDVGDDWLGLDESYRQRQLLVPHGNTNYIGFVEITDPVGELFEETSSREGLINNDAFAELTNFVSRAVKAGVIRVNEARGVKITSSQRDWRSPSTTADKIRSAAQDLTEAARRAASSTESVSATEPPPIVADLEGIARSLTDVAQENEEQTRAFLEEIGMLRVLASLGLTIGEFTHEIRQYLPSIQADTQYFEQLHSGEEAHRPIAERLRSNFSALRTYATYFDRTVSDNSTRQLRAVEIRDVVNGFTSTIQPSLKRVGIELAPPKFEGFRLYSVPMHASEWSSILFNLFTNSRKAIRRRGVRGQLSIRAGRADGSIFIEFADNGDGIPLENRERIFNAFFTTAAPANRRAEDHEDVIGTGLGLKIVRDTVSAYGGSVTLVDPPEGFSTCFRIEVPEAKPEEIGDGDY